MKKLYDDTWLQNPSSFSLFFEQLARFCPRNAIKIRPADSAELHKIFGDIPFGNFYVSGLEILREAKKFPTMAELIEKCRSNEGFWRDKLELWNRDVLAELDKKTR